MRIGALRGHRDWGTIEVDADDIALETATPEAEIEAAPAATDPATAARIGEARTHGPAALDALLLSLGLAPAARPRWEKLLLDVETVAAIPDARIRNYHITQAYHDLSAELRRVIGGDGANWCTFATWASRQAGVTIRKEDVPLAASVAEHVSLAAEALEKASRSVGIGNRKVYVELAPLFAKFVGLCDGQAEPDPAALEAFIRANLRPGATRDGGQDLLVAAFRAYYRAKFEADPDRKAELLFFANAAVGLHEQIRLQPEIAGAMPAGAGTIATLALMKLEMPAETLVLADDVPQRGAEAFPEPLRTIEDPLLRAFLAGYDRTPNTTRGSGAVDWSLLGDRMNYIVDLFRSRHFDATLWSEPLRPEERALLTATGDDRPA